MSKSLNIMFRSMAALVLGFSILSCSGVEIPGGENVAVADYPVNIIAGAGTDTRIAVDDLALTWESDDVLKITAVAADGSSATTELNIYKIDENDPSSAAFSGFVSLLTAPQECYFLYPNSSAINYNPATRRVKIQYNAQTGRHEPIMYAKTAYNQDGMYADMKHVGAILELNVQIPDLETITFAGNNLENIHPVEVDPDSGEIFFPNEVGVQITVPVQTDSPTYMCVPPVNLKKGFSLICSKADGSYLVKSFSSDGSLSGGYDFSTKVSSLIHIDLTGDFEDFSISAASLTGNHTMNGSLISGTEVNFVMNRKGISNKLIEEWGANLLNSEGQVVRNVSYTNATSINGQTVKMNVANNWKLLPAGEYIFTPYYKIYGQVVTLPTQILTITDPGVKLTINGSTSYDKYKAGNVSGANSHANNLIEGISVSTNLDLSVIDNRQALFDSSDLGNGTWSSGTISYGNFTRSERRVYTLKATIKAGNLIYSASRDFHITGLPLEVNFANGDASWGKLGGAKHEGSYMQFSPATFSAQDGAVVSPSFYVPSDINVMTYADATIKKSDYYLYVASCAASYSQIKFGDAKIVMNKLGTLGSHGSKGYKQSDKTVKLTSSSPALIFAASAPVAYNIGLHKIKIEYK